MSTRRAFARAAFDLGLLIGLAAVARAQCLDWADGFGLPGASHSVNTAVVYDDGLGGGPTLYVGGLFFTVGDTLASHVARWNGSAFEPLGAGLQGTPGSNSQVWSSAVFDDGRGPALYFGGDFTRAGGQPASNIARWDGVSWSAVGGGLEDSVYSLAVFDDGQGAGPCLYAGGTSTAGEFLWRWDGSVWSAVGGGGVTSATVVRALAVHDDGGGPALFVAGSFSKVGSLEAHNIARWDGRTWSALGSGTDRWVGALAVHHDGRRRALIAGGDFELAGGVRASRIARWNGQEWQALGSGVDGPVQTLGVHDDGSGPALFVGGSFAVAGGLEASGVARWGGGGWSALGPGLSAMAVYGALGLASFDLLGAGFTQLIVCGDFTGSGDVVSQGIIVWDGANWSSLGAGNGASFSVDAMAVFDDGTGPAHYVGGPLSAAGSAPLAQPKALARWNGTGWSAVPRLPWICGYPSAMAVFDPGTGPGLYVGMSDCVVMWNGTTWDPSQMLGFHTPGDKQGVRTLLVHDDGTGRALYIGGHFMYACSSTYPSPYLVRWDGSNCSAIGGVGPVNALTTFDDGTGPVLIAGGNDDWYAGSGWVGRWDGSSWSQMGGSLAAVSALAVFDDSSGPALFAGVGDGVLRWDGAGWVDLGGATGHALAVHDDGTGGGPALYAAGSTIERWDGTSWVTLGAGIQLMPPLAPWDTRVVRELCSFDDGSGPRLWVGGDILTAGGKPSVGIARWGDTCGCVGAVHCTAKTSSLGCVSSMGVSGITNLSATQPLMLFATQVLNNTPGLVFYGTSGADAQPFQGGTLCVRAPLHRTPRQWSGGNPPPQDCSGSFAMEFKSYAQSLVDPSLVPGASVNAQYWYRDPGDPYGSGLTDAVSFTLCP